MIFTEESSGTNAIAMSMYLGNAVYTFPDHHYCEFLRKTHLYSIPLSISSKTIGYLAAATAEKNMRKELIAVTELLNYQIANEFKTHSIHAVPGTVDRLKLSTKQMVVLKLIMAGMTDRAIAVETGLSFVTVRYHKKNIFKKLGASCTVDAVVKALKLNLISLDEITDFQ